MIRLLVKFFGVIFMVLALITAILDLTRSIANSAITITPLGQEWFNFSRDSLSIAQSFIQRYLHPAIWDPFIQFLLLRPSWLVLFGFSIIFLWMGRRRKRHWQTRFGK